MGLMLPRLTRDVDCEPLGYPGIVLTLHLNVDANQAYQPPEDAQPWDRYGYWYLTQIIDRIHVPGSYTEGGEDELLELDNCELAYKLMHDGDGFDANILTWAIEAWRQSKAEWLLAEVKN